MLIIELQQIPLDKVVHDVPNLDREDPFVVVNHLEPDCPKRSDGTSNEASSWINGASTTEWSYAEKYNKYEYLIQHELDLITGGDIYR